MSRFLHNCIVFCLVLFPLSGIGYPRIESDTLQDYTCVESENLGINPKPKKRKQASKLSLFQSKELRKVFKPSKQFNRKHKHKAGRKRNKLTLFNKYRHQKKYFKKKKNKKKMRKKNFHNINSNH